MINQHADHLYGMLLQELYQCADKKNELKKNLECSFQVCTTYWGMLRRRLETGSFGELEEEITFFKKWKPLFISEMEYYGLRYHAQLFFDEVSDPAALQKFLQRESARLPKFIDDNRNFYDYYQSGSQDHDAQWFVRKTGVVYESLQDHRISGLLALERYAQFIDELINQLNMNSTLA